MHWTSRHKNEYKSPEKAGNRLLIYGIHFDLCAIKPNSPYYFCCLFCRALQGLLVSLPSGSYLLRACCLGLQAHPLELVAALGREKQGQRDLVVGQSLVDHPILGVACAGDLLAFFGFVDHARHRGVFLRAAGFEQAPVAVRGVRGPELAERGVRVAVLDVPLVQIFHVGDAVQAAFLL